MTRPDRYLRQHFCSRPSFLLISSSRLPSKPHSHNRSPLSHCHSKCHIAAASPESTRPLISLGSRSTGGAFLLSNSVVSFLHIISCASSPCRAWDGPQQHDGRNTGTGSRKPWSWAQIGPFKETLRPESLARLSAPIDPPRPPPASFVHAKDRVCHSHEATCSPASRDPRPVRARVPSSALLLSWSSGIVEPTHYWIDLLSHPPSSPSQDSRAPSPCSEQFTPVPAATPADQPLKSGQPVVISAQTSCSLAAHNTRLFSSSCRGCLL